MYKCFVSPLSDARTAAAAILALSVSLCLVYRRPSNPDVGNYLHTMRRKYERVVVDELFLASRLLVHMDLIDIDVDTRGSAKCAALFFPEREDEIVMDMYAPKSLWGRVTWGVRVFASFLR